MARISQSRSPRRRAALPGVFGRRLRVALALGLVALLGAAPFVSSSFAARRTAATPLSGKVSGEVSATAFNAQDGGGKKAPVLVGQVQQMKQDPELESVFRDFDVIRMDADDAAAEVQRTGTLAFSTSEQVVEIDLVPNDLRAENYRSVETLDGGVERELPHGPVTTYKGVVRGLSGAKQARFTIDGDKVEGLIITEGENYFIEPAKRHTASAKSDDLVFYKSSDVREDSFGMCGTTMAEKVGAQVERAKAGSSNSPSAGGPVIESLRFSPERIVEIATDADFEFFSKAEFNRLSSNVNQEIQTIINEVDGI
ncbi:MAG: hypothetical protein ACRD68_18875, partial [Pyrinomonadaceae bacterium]